VLVPNLVGLTLQQAAAELNGTLPYRTVQQSSNKPSGQVLSQDPKAGSSVKAGTTVVLTVSSQTSTNVPNLVGQSQAAAGNLLAQNSLTVGTVSQACSQDGSVPSGDVIASNPGAGQALPPQSPVNLSVSTGPCQVILQNVVGQSQASATSTLKAQSSQLTVNPVNTANCATGQNGNVTAQSPTGGTQVSSSSTVTITVCNNTGTPSVTGVSPSSGPAAGGTTITVHGTGFSTSNTSISVGGSSATNVSCSSSTTCTATTPSGTSGKMVDVTVTTSGGTSSTSGADQFTYQ
jgi:serine/threonine-protein kinase